MSEIYIGDSNYIIDGKVFLTRCPKCKRGNYIMNVSKGICTWCGLVGSEYYKDKLKENEQ